MRVVLWSPEFLQGGWSNRRGAERPLFLREEQPGRKLREGIPMNQWEYRVVEVEGNFGARAIEKPSDVLQKHLEIMGTEGWELTALVPSVYRRNADAHCRELVCALLCFKRERPTP